MVHRRPYLFLAWFGLGALLLHCSDAPRIIQAARRMVLVELFSTPPDE